MARPKNTVLWLDTEPCLIIAALLKVRDRALQYKHTIGATIGAQIGATFLVFDMNERNRSLSPSVYGLRHVLFKLLSELIIKAGLLLSELTELITEETLLSTEKERSL